MIRRNSARNACAVAMVAVTLSTSGSAQTVMGDLLSDLARYLNAAGRFVVEAATGLESVEAAQIPPEDRTKAHDELRSISQELSKVRVVQTIALTGLFDYVTTVRQNGFEPQRDTPSWRGAIREIRDVSAVVRSTLELVEGSAWLKVALSEEDRLTLREVLLGRVTLLQRLEQLPAPSTVAEVDLLDGMLKHYQELMSALFRLNAALTRAAERIK